MEKKSKQKSNGKSLDTDILLAWLRVLLVVIIFVAFVLICWFAIPPRPKTPERFVVVYKQDSNYAVVADTETQICYFKSRQGMVVLLDAEGNPMRWNNDEEAEIKKCAAEMDESLKK